VSVGAESSCWVQSSCWHRGRVDGRRVGVEVVLAGGRRVSGISLVFNFNFNF
jgi:hypothetical protein